MDRTGRRSRGGRGRGVSFEDVLPVKQSGLNFTSRRVYPEDKKKAAFILKQWWEQRWSKPPERDWTDRPAPPELAGAISSGWLPSGGTVADLGCGTAEIAAWFAEHGYRATAIDIAQGAVDQAAARFGHIDPPIEFIAADLCAAPLPGRTFDIMVDRGCLHQIPDSLLADYVRNLASMAAPSGKLVIFSKAFRRNPFGDEREMALRCDWVRKTFDGLFVLERGEPVYLRPGHPEEPLPGMSFWLSRKEA